MKIFISVKEEKESFLKAINSELKDLESSKDPQGLSVLLVNQNFSKYSKSKDLFQ